MIISATTATFAQPPENGCALSRRQPQAQPAQPRPYRECGEGCAPPALSLRRLGAPTLRAPLPSSAPSNIRPNRLSHHSADSISDHLHGVGRPSSFPTSIDIHLGQHQPRHSVVIPSDQQSLSLLACGDISIVFTRLFALAGLLPRHWEWHGKIAAADNGLSTLVRSVGPLAKPGLAQLFPGSAPVFSDRPPWGENRDPRPISTFPLPTAAGAGKPSLACAWRVRPDLAGLANAFSARVGLSVRPKCQGPQRVPYCRGGAPE